MPEIQLETRPNASLNMHTLFRHPEQLQLYRITLTDAQYLIFPPDMAALILDLMIDHVSLTADELLINISSAPDPTQNGIYRMFQVSIAAADATAKYDGFGSQPIEKHAGWSPIFLTGKSSMAMSGGTAYITVLAWKTS